MEIRSVRLIAGLLAVAGASALLSNGCLAPRGTARLGGPDDPAGRAELAEATVSGWWPLSALAARRTIAQYGVPDEVRPERLAWTAKGPWKRVVVRNITPPYVSGDELGVVEQRVRYTLAPGQLDELRRFDRSLGYEPGARELASRSDREEVNFLRLNLADDIVRRRTTPDEARRFQERALRLENTGKASPYMQGLRFTPEPD